MLWTNWKRSLVVAALASSTAMPLNAQDEPKQEETTQEEVVVDEKDGATQTFQIIKTSDGDKSGKVVVRSNIKAIIVDEEGNVTERTLTKEGDDAKEGVEFNLSMEGDLIKLMTPDGDVRKIDLGKLAKEGAAKGVIQLKAMPHIVLEEMKKGEGGNIQVEVLHDALKTLEVEIDSSLEGLEGALSELGEVESKELHERIMKAIHGSLKDVDHNKLMKLGKAAIVVTDGVEDIEKKVGDGTFEIRVETIAGEDGKPMMKVMRENVADKVKQQIAKRIQSASNVQEVRVKAVEGAESAVLQKLDTILSRLEKLESDVAELKGDK